MTKAYERENLPTMYDVAFVLGGSESRVDACHVTEYRDGQQDGKSERKARRRAAGKKKKKKRKMDASSLSTEVSKRAKKGSGRGKSSNSGARKSVHWLYSDDPVIEAAVKRALAKEVGGISGIPTAAAVAFSSRKPSTDSPSAKNDLTAVPAANRATQRELANPVQNAAKKVKPAQQKGPVAKEAKAKTHSTAADNSIQSPADSAAATDPPAAVVVAPREFTAGTLVDVQPRMGPGENFPGGVGKVTKAHKQAGDDNALTTYDIAYVLGGRESHVPGCFVAEHKDEPRGGRSSRRSRSRK